MQVGMRLRYGGVVSGVVSGVVAGVVIVVSSLVC